MVYRADEWPDTYWNTPEGRRAAAKSRREAEMLRDAKELPIYKKIARAALMSRNGLSEEDATKRVQESSDEELELQVCVKGLIDNALKGFEKYSGGLKGYYIETLKEIIMTGRYTNGPVMDFFKNFSYWLGTRSINYDRNDMILLVLSTIHDGWVKDNQKEFMARDKKYQHMPIELIGWNEVKSDLLLLKPILSEIIYYDRELDIELEEAYNKRVKAFLEEKGITDISELREQISRGAEFYPALEGQEDIIRALQDPKFVEEQVISGIRDKGIGTNDQFLQQLFGGKDIGDAEELETLREQKSVLIKEANAIGGIEDLIGTRENQGPTLDE